jgi:hypothetical protein
LLKVDDDTSIRFPQLMDGLSRIPIIRCCNDDGGVDEVPIWWSSFRRNQESFQTGIADKKQTGNWGVNRTLVAPYLVPWQHYWRWDSESVADTDIAGAAFDIRGQDEDYDAIMAAPPSGRVPAFESLVSRLEHAMGWHRPNASDLLSALGQTHTGGMVYPSFGHGVGHVMNRAGVEAIVRAQSHNDWTKNSGVWMEDVAFGMWFEALAKHRGGCRIHDSRFVTAMVGEQSCGGICTLDGLQYGLNSYRKPCGSTNTSWRPFFDIHKNLDCL